MNFLRSLALLILAFFCLSSCIGVGNQVVGFASANGNLDVRTDGNAWLAIGYGDGEAGVFVKGSGFPLTAPFALGDGCIWFRNIELGVEEQRQLDEPLPAWTEPLFRPGEVEALEQRFGIDIVFL